MNRTRRILGQILLAAGATLALGGVSSFLLDSVELRFINHIVSTESGRILWIAAYGLLACAGFYLWRSSRPRNPSS